MSDKLNAYVIGDDKVIVANHSTMLEVCNKLGIVHAVYACCIDDCTAHDLEYNIMLAKQRYAETRGGMKLVGDFSKVDIPMLIHKAKQQSLDLITTDDTMMGMKFFSEIEKDIRVIDHINLIKPFDQMKKSSGIAALAVMAAIASTQNEQGQKPYRTKTTISGEDIDKPLPKGVNRYFFDADGNTCTADIAIFTCTARNYTNAKRKFNNRTI